MIYIINIPVEQMEQPLSNLWVRTLPRVTSACNWGIQGSSRQQFLVVDDQLYLLSHGCPLTQTCSHFNTITETLSSSTNLHSLDGTIADNRS